MTPHDEAIAKIARLPEGLAQEVNDFVDFLLMRSNSNQWQLWMQFSEGQQTAEVGFSDYLSDLKAYEDALESGKVQW